MSPATSARLPALEAALAFFAPDLPVVVLPALGLPAL